MVKFAELCVYTYILRSHCGVCFSNLIELTNLRLTVGDSRRSTPTRGTRTHLRFFSRPHVQFITGKQLRRYVDVIVGKSLQKRRRHEIVRFEEPRYQFAHRVEPRRWHRLGSPLIGYVWSYLEETDLGRLSSVCYRFLALVRAGFGLTDILARPRDDNEAVHLTTRWLAAFINLNAFGTLFKVQRVVICAPQRALQMAFFALDHLPRLEFLDIERLPFPSKDTSFERALIRFLKQQRPITQHPKLSTLHLRATTRIFDALARSPIAAQLTSLAIEFDGALLSIFLSSSFIAVQSQDLSY